MAVSSTTKARAAPRRAAAGEGQWALGHREPLNPNERIKKDDNPLNVRARIENIYAHRGFASHRPGGPARPVPLVGPLHPAQGRHRRRPHRGAGAARARGRVLHAPRPGRRRPARPRPAARDRGHLHRVRPGHRRHHRPAEHPAALDPGRGHAGDLAAARGGRPADHRGVRRLPRGSCWAARSPGSAADEVLDPTPAIDEIVDRYVGDTAFSNLPRKFKSSISWLADMPYEANDISFLGVEHPEHGPGFDLWVGGGLSTNPMLAKRLGVWVPLDEVPDVWAGVVGIFRDYGYRRLRNRARLKFLVADWGVERFREVLEKEYLGRTLLDGPAPELPREADRPHRRAQAARRAELRRRRAGGRAGSPARSSAQLADLVEAHGSGRVRLTPYQKLLVLDVPRSRSESLVDGAARDRAGGPAVGLAARHDGLHRHRVLQARDRRDQGPRRGAGGPAGGAAAATSTPTSRSTSTAARTPAPAPRSPTSASRASWCSARTASRSRASRCTSAAGWAWPRARPPASAASCAASRPPPTSFPAYVERLARRYLAGRDRGRDVRPLGGPGGRGGSCDERAESRAAPLLLPVLRRGGPAPERGSRTAPGSATPAPGSSRSSSSDCWSRRCTR